MASKFADGVRNVIFYVLLAVFIVLLAVLVRFFGTLDTDYYHGHHSTYYDIQQHEQSPLLLHILWNAPFMSGGGYCSDATTLVQSLLYTQAYPWDLITVDQHGDMVNMEFLAGLPDDISNMLLVHSKNAFPSYKDMSISICQSEPGAWYPPLFETTPCPVPYIASEPASFLVGRTLFETDRLPEGWIERLVTMDEIWVPSEYHRDIFIRSGCEEEKLVVIPEAVDTRFFSEESADNFDFKSFSIFGEAADESSFTFLSIFKWEERKGWDILLKAYFEEFTAKDRVQLIMLTTPPSDYVGDVNELKKRNFLKKIHSDLRITRPLEDLPMLNILRHIPMKKLPSLYASIDTLVQPSRGEGWGLPHAEAMAMGRLVIATNWSGNLEFMNENNSILLPIEGLQEIENGPFKGHKWAIPSGAALKKSIRDVFEDIDQFTANDGVTPRGEQAKADIAAKYSLKAVGDVLMDHLYTIPGKIAARLEDL